MSEKKPNLFKRALAAYDQLCKDLDVDNGGCRGCIPIVKFDEEPEKKSVNKNQEKN